MLPHPCPPPYGKSVSLKRAQPPDENLPPVLYSPLCCTTNVPFVRTCSRGTVAATSNEHDWMDRDHPPPADSQRDRLGSALDPAPHMLASSQGPPLLAHSRSPEIYDFSQRSALYNSYHGTGLSDSSLQFPRTDAPQLQTFVSRASSLQDERAISPLAAFEGMASFPQPSAHAGNVLPSQYGEPRNFYGSSETTAPLQTSLQAQFAIPPLALREPQVYRTPTSLGYHHPQSQSQSESQSYSSSTSSIQDDQALRRTQQASFEQAFQRYEVAIKRVFDDIIASRLETASSSLLNLSNWLLTSVPELGLTRDDEDLRDERVRLWNEFNAAWLALLQKQIDLTDDEDDQLQPGQTIISIDFLERMGRHLVRLCDSLEQHGLVDYELGVLEEEIITTLTDALEILEEREEDTEDAVSEGPAHSHASESVDL